MGRRAMHQPGFRALIANYSVPGVGVATVWTVGFVALFGGILMIVQAFCTRSA